MHADVFQALADPTRRRIVEVLCAGEQAVNDVVGAVDIHQSGVSRHLGILHRAGFVQVRADGPRRLYSLQPEPFREKYRNEVRCLPEQTPFRPAEPVTVEYPIAFSASM